jgi:hypothetical protein
MEALVMSTWKDKNLCFYLVLFVLAFSFCPQKSNADTPEPIFQESFESLAEIQANGGMPSGVTIVPGKDGNGVLVQNGGSFLSYRATGKINFRKGTIEFWVKPNWNGADDVGYKYFFSAGTSDNQREFSLYKYPINSSLQMDFKDRPTNVDSQPWFRSIGDWTLGTWHRVRFYWDLDQHYAIYEVDGQYGKYQDLGSFPFSALPDTFFIGSRYSKGGQADAVIDNLKIWDQSLLPVFPYPKKNFNPADPASVAAFKKLFANNGFFEDFETYNDTPADCQKLSDSINPGKNILFYQKPPFSRVYENSIPATDEITDVLAYQSAQGQFEDFFFNVYSRTNLNNVKVKVTSFIGPGGESIPRENLDLRVVKNWFQDGTGTQHEELPVYVPELLMKDDTIPIDYANWTYRNLPSFPQTDYAKTAMAQFTSKQFVIIANIPSNVQAGAYSATVTLSADGVPGINVQINLDVLPFTLRDSGKTYSIPYFSRLTLNADQTRTPLIMQKELADIRNHGFNSLLLGDEKPLDNYDKFMSFVENAGFGKAVFWIGAQNLDSRFSEFQYTTNLLKDNSYSPFQWGKDEPGDPAKGDTALANEHIPFSKAMHEMGAKVGVSGQKPFLDHLSNPADPLYEPPDRASYNNFDDYAKGIIAGTIEKSKNLLETYYWQGGSSEDPKINRVYSGFWLWNNKMDGIDPNVYQGYGGNTSNVYNDFIRSETLRRNQMTYPSQEGPVPTFQWEALRAGIDDGKYLATWQWYHDLVARNYPGLADQSKAVIDRVLARYKDADFFGYKVAKIALLAKNQSQNFVAQLAADRAIVAAEIVKLVAISSNVRKLKK